MKRSLIQLFALLTTKLTTEMDKMKDKKELMKQSNLVYFDSKVVSRNVITDWIQGIRNLLGLELKSYTNIVNETVKELLSKVNVKLKWYRIDIEEFGRGGFLISIYGEKEK